MAVCVGEGARAGRSSVRELQTAKAKQEKMEPAVEATMTSGHIIFWLLTTGRRRSGLTGAAA